MNELSPAERRALKARAHHLNPVVIVGDAGLTPAVLREIDVHLKSHELIKIRVLGDDRDARATMIGAICTALNASPVQQIGKILVVFRPKPREEEAPAPAPKKSARPRKPSSPAGRKNPARGRSASRSTDRTRARPSRYAAPRGRKK